MRILSLTASIAIALFMLTGAKAIQKADATKAEEEEAIRKADATKAEEEAIRKADAAKTEAEEKDIIGRIACETCFKEGKICDISTCF